MPHEALVILWYVCDLLIISGALMLLTGPVLKIYRSLNKHAYPSQPNWGVPEKLCVVGFFLFVIGFVADHYILS